MCESEFEPMDLSVLLYFAIILYLSYHPLFYHEHKGFVWCVSVDIIAEVLHSHLLRRISDKNKEYFFFPFLTVCSFVSCHMHHHLLRVLLN